MKQHWTKLELVDYWTLSLREREYIDKKNNKFKLAVGMKIRYFDQYGYFPNAGSDIPLIILEYVANQLGVEINEIDQYNWQLDLLKYIIKKLERTMDSVNSKIQT
jgi:hypothetical protein